MMRQKSVLLSSLIVLAFVVGCTPAPVEDEAPVETPQQEEEEADHEHPHHQDDEEEAGVLGMKARAMVYDGEGELIGEVHFEQTEAGVAVQGRIEGQEPGPKGFHVHEHGVCDPPDFMGAGSHFNPAGHPHGGPHDDAEERHAGDFGNLEFDEDGVAEFSFVDDVITLGAGKNNVVGQALIVHVQEDDLVSQPVGDAGGRAGCGLIEEVHED